MTGSGPSAGAIWTSLRPDVPPTVEWIRAVPDRSVVLLLGAFDPPTSAHVRVLHAAANAEDAPAGFCMTRTMLDRPADELLDPVRRVELITELADELGWGFAVANRGTYLEVERALTGAGFRATFVVGSDKLRQLADPSFYPDGTTGVAATFAEVRLLVVPRTGTVVDRDDVRCLDAVEVFSDPDEMTISGTEVRRRIRAGGDITGLVPPAVASALEGYTSAG